MTAPDPSQVAAEIAEILDQVDAVRAQFDDHAGSTDQSAAVIGGGDTDPDTNAPDETTPDTTAWSETVDIASLQAQADLFERAHAVLTDALDHLDRV